jgi:hypothetical protein
MILTLSIFPGTREKTLEIFLGGLFEKNLREAVGKTGFFFFKACQLLSFYPRYVCRGQ